MGILVIKRGIDGDFMGFTWLRCGFHELQRILSDHGGSLDCDKAVMIPNGRCLSHQTSFQEVWLVVGIWYGIWFIHG